MWVKYPIIIPLLFGLALLQASFLVRLGVIASFLNLVFTVFFVVCFFEEKNRYYQGIFLSITAGAMLDIFSGYQFGFSIISLLITYGAIKIVIYFIAEITDSYLLLRFIPFFLAAFIFYNLVLHFFINFPQIDFPLNNGVSSGLVLNTIFTIISYFIYIKFIRPKTRQLTLF